MWNNNKVTEGFCYCFELNEIKLPCLTQRSLEVTQTHTTFKVLKYCSLKLQVIKLLHNFILT